MGLTVDVNCTWSLRKASVVAMSTCKRISFIFFLRDLHQVLTFINLSQCGSKEWEKVEVYVSSAKFLASFLSL